MTNRAAYARTPIRTVFSNSTSQALLSAPMMRRRHGSGYASVTAMHIASTSAPLQASVTVTGSVCVPEYHSAIRPWSSVSGSTNSRSMIGSRSSHSRTAAQAAARARNRSGDDRAAVAVTDGM
jgi:hypothetical protein